MKTVKRIFFNLLILTGTSLILRSINLTFHVYISNKLGPEGVGLFQLIGSVYFLAIVFSTSGIRFATTCLVAEELGTGNNDGVIKVVHNCIIYALLFSIATMTIINFSSDFIGTYWINDKRSILSLRIFAYSLPFIASSSVLSGYFMAVRKVINISTVQFGEQIIKIGFTIIFLNIMLPWGLEFSCVAVVLGSSIGEVFSFLLIFFLYLIDLRKTKRNGRSGLKLVSRMLNLALPIAFSSYISTIIRTIQHILIPSELKKSGESSQEALSTFGMIHGMTLPVIMFPSVFLDSISDLIVPELAECKANKSNKRLNYIITRVFNICILLSICIMCLFLRFYKEFGIMIYNSTETAHYIRVLAPLIPFMYLDNIVDNMLKGIGEQKRSMRYNIIVSLLNIGLIYILLPRYAIVGYIFTIYFARILNFLLSLKRLIKVTKLSVDCVGIIMSVFCIIGSISISDILSRFIQNNIYYIKNALIYFQIPFIIILYLFFLYMFSCITKDDIKWARSLFK